MNYLFEASEDQPEIKPESLFDPEDLKSKYNRSIILNEVIHLHQNFTGETASRLETLFISLSFHLDSISKLNSRNWYIAAKGMRELANMNVREASGKMIPFLNNKNGILRMEARISMMKLSTHEPFSFLTHETESLTDWDQANIFAMLNKMPETSIPDFSTWLNSKNKSVVLFCISMIGRHRQQQSTDIMIKMMDNPDSLVRLAVIRALRMLSATSAEEKLIKLYPSSDDETKNEILKTLETIGKEQSDVLMEQILRQPVADYSIAIQAVRSLLATRRNGKERLNELLASAAPELKLIIQHAIDPRL